MKTILAVLVSTGALGLQLHAGIFNVLHSFGAPLVNTGVQPAGGLVADTNGTFYGTDFQGGLYSYGTIYNYSTNGSYPLWNFTGGSDGGYPVGDLVLSGNTLYGVASTGGGGGGAVFKIETDGSGFAVLYAFTNGTDGNGPVGGLVLSGNMLYGVTDSGGAGGSGTVFKLNTDGSGFQVLHPFTQRDPTAYTNVDGAFPQGKLVISGNTLYGTTSSGGDNQFGTVFAINTDNNDFTNLHNFAASEGQSPQTGLTLSGNKLFGTTFYGGTEGNGTIFSLNTDGSGFATRYSLSNDGNDGSRPQAPLLLVCDTLYGSASSDGANGNGTLFSLQTVETNFTVLYNFSALDPDDAMNDDGANPTTGLILYDGVLYGTAGGGGFVGSGSVLQNFGTLFQMNPDGSDFTTDYLFYNISSANDGISPECPLVMSGNTVYGMTQLGGLNGYGGIFRENRDGTGFALLHSFDYTDGGYPLGGLALSGNTLYGTTSGGGAHLTNGVVFAINTDGSGYSILHSFAGGSEGYGPSAGPTVGSNVLYGTTSRGGTNGLGTIFSLNLNNHQLATIFHFAGTNGENPAAPLLLSGNTLYGETAARGIGAGNLFRIQTDGSSFTNLRVFSFVSGLGAAGEGETPGGGLVLSGDTLYGTTENGGDNHTGNIFKINTDGSGYATLFNFESTAFNGLTQTNFYGANPRAGLVLDGDTLYGTAANGGSQGYGTLFAVTTNANGSSGITILHTFTDGSGDMNAIDGGDPGGGVLISGGELLGVSGGGGPYEQGVVFSYYLVPPLQITTVNHAPFVYWQNDGESHTLQTTTNLADGIWTTALTINHTNPNYNIGLLVTNRPISPKAFYRLTQ